MSYQILARKPADVSSSSPTQIQELNTPYNGEENAPAKEDDRSTLNSSNALEKVVEASTKATTTTNTHPTTVMSAEKQRSIRRIVLQESTFSSMIPVRTVRKQKPTRQYRTMLTPKQSNDFTSNPTSSPVSTKVNAGQQSLFIVNDEMGRPIHPAPTPAPKGLFEVRDEMGQVITPDSPPRKASRQASNARSIDSSKPKMHIQDEDGTPISSRPTSAPASVPRSGLSKFTATQQLFKISGLSDFEVPNEILQLSGRPNGSQVKWKDLNNHFSSERYDAHEEPIRVTEQSLGRGPAPVSPQASSTIAADAHEDPIRVTEQSLGRGPAPVSPQASSTIAEEAPREKSPESNPESVPSVSNEKSAASSSQSDLFVVRDEMGKSIHPTPTAVPNGPFVVRDEMGKVMNSPPLSPKVARTNENSIPKTGLSKFAATKELFKVSGMSDFAVPSEMHQL